MGWNTKNDLFNNLNLFNRFPKFRFQLSFFTVCDMLYSVILETSHISKSLETPHKWPNLLLVATKTPNNIIEKGKKKVFWKTEEWRVSFWRMEMSKDVLKIGLV